MTTFFYTTFYCGSSPLEPYQLANGAWLYPGIRKDMLQTLNTKISCDSTYFISQGVSKEEFQIMFEKFLIFHSFLTGDQLGIETYELDLTEEVQQVEAQSIDDLVTKLNKNPERLVPFDYTNIGQLLYTNFDKTTSPPISFNDIYKKFLELNDKKQHLIYLYTYNTKRGAKRIERMVYKTEYLDIALHFTIIEALVDKSQRFCSQIIPECEECHKTNIQHEMKGIKQIIKDELKELIPVPIICNEYSASIDAAHDIRNRVYHYAEMDKAKNIKKPISTMIYNASFSSENYKKDKNALNILSFTIKILCRNFILMKYFDIKYFPMPPQHIFITIGDELKTSDTISTDKK